MKKIAIYQKKRKGAPAWFNKWIQSPAWLRGFGICLVIGGAVYTLNMLLGDPGPGSMWGLSYGIGAAILFMGALLYALRRKTIRVNRLPRAWTYLQFHVYGGTLFLVLMLMHSNFRLPEGVLTSLLWGLSVWIVLSGFLGSVLQKWIPTVLNASLATEVNYNRIPELLEDIQKKAGLLVDQSGERVKIFFQQNLENRLGIPQFRWIYFVDVAGTIRSETLPFEYLGKYLDGAEKERLDQLEAIYKTKLEIDVHYTLQKVLRMWLLLHIPVSLLILMLLVIHVFAVVYY